MVTVPNVWTNFDGTVVIDRVGTGDRWIMPSSHSLDLHNQHLSQQHNADAERLYTVKNALRSSKSYQQPSKPKSPTEVFDKNGFQWIPSPQFSGGFRGVPRVVNGEQFIGSHPMVTDGPPSIISLLNSNLLTNKSRQQIMDEGVDAQKLVNQRWHERSDERRP